MRFLASATLLYTTFLTAETGNMLISSEALARQLNDKTLIVLHVGTQKDYDTGHIPGARLLTLPDISVTDDRGLRLQLPSVDVLKQAFGKTGITDQSKIVIYPAGDSVQSATRVWFTLDYLGLGDRTALLDGGLLLWKAENRPLSTEAPLVTPTTFTATARPDLVVDAQWLNSHLGKHDVQIYDARLPEFYNGENAGGMPRGGHIPGAISTPYITLLESNRKLKTAETLKTAMGAKPGSPVVTYCHIGQQATVLYFAAKYLGLGARLYDGSFQDWSSRSELPVETK